MRNTTPTILALNPGTKSIGLAIWKNGYLDEWAVKTFKGSWSDNKLKDILFALQNFIDEHEIKVLAVKTPDPFRTSTALDELVSELSALAKRKNLKVHSVTLRELKKFYSKEKTFTKSAMIRLIAKKYPALYFEYNKEQKNRNAYYAKMFEAIGIAEYCFWKLFSK